MSDGMNSEVQFPDDWKYEDGSRKRQNSFSFDIWKYGTDIFNGNSEIPLQSSTFTQQDPTIHREAPKFQYDSQTQTNVGTVFMNPINKAAAAITGSSATRTPRFKHPTQSFEETMAFQVSSSAGEYQAKATPFGESHAAQRKASLPFVSNHRDFKESSYSRSASFTKSWNQSRESTFSDRKASYGQDHSKKDNLNWRKKENPIGVFIWGFPFEPKVSDLLENFSSFGEIRNGKLFMKNISTRQTLIF